MDEMHVTRVRGSDAADTFLAGNQIKVKEPPDTGQAAKPAVEANVDQAVEKLKDVAAQHKVNLDFSVHKGTGRTIIKVVDAKTHKVLRELPPEQVLDMVVSIEEVAGQLVSTKA